MIERHGIFPSFSERALELAHRRSSNFKLNVMPRGPRSIPRIQFDDLDVSVVAGVISTPMTEIDAPNEGNVVIDTRGMSDEDQFLVVRSPAAHPFVEQHFASRLGHLNGQAVILLLIEAEAITM